MKISKRKDGRYSTQLKLPNGKYKTIYGKTKTEVREKYQDALVQLKTEPFVEPNRMTLKEWFDYWLETYTVNLRDRTKYYYTSTFKQYFLPVLGNKQLQKITSKDCQSILNKMSEKLSPGSIQVNMGKLQRVLGDAVKEKIINKNPCSGLLYPKKPDKKIVSIEPDEIKLLLNTAYKICPQYADLFEFLLLTGLRVSELFGLTIDNYNKNKQTVTVEKQYVKVLGKYVFTPTKTGKTRTILLTDRAVEIIENRIEQTDALRKSNHDYNENDLIFFKLNNTCFKTESVSNNLQKVCKICSLPRYKVHDLRHTYATLALLIGDDVKTVQENLGHSSAKMTLDTYATSTDSMKKNLNKKLNKFWESL